MLGKWACTDSYDARFSVEAHPNESHLRFVPIVFGLPLLSDCLPQSRNMESSNDTHSLEVTTTFVDTHVSDFGKTIVNWPLSNNFIVHVLVQEVNTTLMFCPKSRKLVLEVASSK